MTNDHAHEAQSGQTQVTWNNGIKQMFTQKDIDCMKKRGLDLSSYTAVRSNASNIYTRVKSGSMPEPSSGESPWSQDMVNQFLSWWQNGCPEN
ncbi:hypothetical protein [Burkholderia ubonensis]|nr:hypothetical protein [Burkholderia ubonensis]